jgi:hypothetical protein
VSKETRADEGASATAVCPPVMRRIGGGQTASGAPHPAQKLQLLKCCMSKTPIAVPRWWLAF